VLLRLESSVLALHFLFMHINTLANSVCRRIQMPATPPPRPPTASSRATNKFVT